MTQRDNILQELYGLESTLVTVTPQNIYEVPRGYFEELANQVLGHIKSLNAENASEETNHLSPLVSSISKQIPFPVPDGYFEKLEETIMASIRNSGDYQTPKEELESISPFLSELNKETPYSVPEGYFEKVNSEIPSKLNISSGAKVISITHRKWFRYAAAAVVIGFISLGGLLFEHRPSVDPDQSPDEWIAKNLKKVSTDKLDDFIRLTDEESSTKETTTDKEEKPNEIKDLMKDVPANQIQEFINETSALGDDNSIMN